MNEHSREVCMLECLDACIVYYLTCLSFQIKSNIKSLLCLIFYPHSDKYSRGRGIVLLQHPIPLANVRVVFFQQYFSYIAAVSFIAVRNWRKPPNYRPVAIHWQTLRGILCEDCIQWFHIKCIDLPVSEYNKLSTSSDSWYCNPCTLPNFTDSFFDLDLSEESNTPNHDYVPSSSEETSGVNKNNCTRFKELRDARNYTQETL